jgi:hypothetical protein
VVLILAVGKDCAWAHKGKPANGKAAATPCIRRRRLIKDAELRSSLDMLGTPRVGEEGNVEKFLFKP